jgi:hypothetical protein
VTKQYPDGTVGVDRLDLEVCPAGEVLALLNLSLAARADDDHNEAAAPAPRRCGRPAPRRRRGEHQLGSRPDSPQRQRPAVLT